LRIDPADAETAVATASADLQDAENELQEARRALDLARDELAAAEAQAQLRAQALTRQSDLRERGFGSDSAVETAALAEAAITQTVFSRRQSVSTAETRVALAGSGLTRRKIALADAERDLEETTLRAPFSGAFSDVSAELGVRVAQNEQLGMLIDPQALEATFRIASAQYLRLLDENGALVPAQVQIALETPGADIATRGQLTGVAAQVGEGQTGRQIFARLDQARGFQPGDFVTVSVTEPTLEDVDLLPAAALTAEGQVLALDADDRLEPIPVTVLRRQGEMVLIAARDLAGRDVVTQVTPVLGAGIKVRPVRALPDSAQADRAQVGGAAPPATAPSGG